MSVAEGVLFLSLTREEARMMLVGLAVLVRDSKAMYEHSIRLEGIEDFTDKLVEVTEAQGF